MDDPAGGHAAEIFYTLTHTCRRLKIDLYPDRHANCVTFLVLSSRTPASVRNRFDQPGTDLIEVNVDVGHAGFAAQSSTARFGIFSKSTVLRVNTVISLAIAMAPILRSIVPIRIR